MSQTALPGKARSLALVSIAELGLCSVGPLGDIPFEPGVDPIDSIAQATAWLEMDR